MNDRLRSIAIYLPQFHPTPENDGWWGKGFTEWTNVARAKPRFLGHEQPHIPADLGFYDLRLAEAREAQAELAREYGISGFCYYHYWFSGRRVLHRPLDEMLRTGRPDFPFMLCWANENWTRRWDGLEQDVLLRQEYSHEDDEGHIRYLIEHFFADSRYIRVDDKPVFVVYRPLEFPDVAKTLATWRQAAKAAGLAGLYLVYMQGFNQKAPPQQWGFDAAIDFQPDFMNYPPEHTPPEMSLKFQYGQQQKDRFFDYSEVAQKMLRRWLRQSEKVFPCVFPRWDNSPRKALGPATILLNSLPSEYESWLGAVVERFRPFSQEENFVFINAWNEWAEGNYLEPCQRWGRQYLQATKDALSRPSDSANRSPTVINENPSFGIRQPHRHKRDL